MARPTKRGLDYFPVDKDLFRDRKIRALVRRAGADGPTIYLWLLCEIYGTEGDRITITEDMILDCANDCGMDEGRVLEVIDLATEVQLFDPEEKENGVLTSPAIQSRYSSAVRRRIREREKFAENDDFFTVDDNGVSVDDNSVSVNNNLITVDDNSINDAGNSQRKVKKRKVYNININNKTKQTNKSDFENFQNQGGWSPPEKNLPAWENERALVASRIWERGISSDLIDCVTVAILRRWIDESQFGKWRTKFRREREVFEESGGRRGRSHLWELIRSELAIIFREHGEELPSFRRSNPEPPAQVADGPPTIPFPAKEEQADQTPEEITNELDEWQVDLHESLEELTRRVMSKEKLPMLEARAKAFLLRTAKRKLESLSATG